VRLLSARAKKPAPQAKACIVPDFAELESLKLITKQARQCAAFGKRRDFRDVSKKVE
jgi:hypothetical protein